MKVVTKDKNLTLILNFMNRIVFLAGEINIRLCIVHVEIFLFRPGSGKD